jgi:hypothetical protein
MELRMSRKERDRLKVMAALAECRLKQVEAGRLLRLSVRQVRRLLRRYEREGDVGLVHRSRGRPSNRRIPEATRRRVMALVRRHYADFGPTLASEKLAERDGIEVSREWLRQRMIEAPLRTVRRRRVRHHTWRERRPCFGELVQMDTSEHAWFEGRGEAEPVLVTMIDDATSRVRMRFYPSDTTEANLDLLGRYLRRHGRPLALYEDRNSIFHVNRPPSREEALAGRTSETQFGRALRALGIDNIPASSPQAKGRVERAFGTEQDRLVKELRLRGLSDIEAANAYLDAEYIPWRNQRFSVRPARSVDAHRSRRGFDLKAILSVQETRTVTNDYTVRYHGQVLQIERRSIRAGLRKAKIMVEQRLDGAVKLRWQGRYLRYHRVFPRPKTTTKTTSTRETTTDRRRVAASASVPSASAPTRRPAKDHPWRQPFKRSVLSGGKPDISTLR